MTTETITSVAADLRILRTGDKGGPSLLIGTASYGAAPFPNWTSVGSGCKMEVTIWRPQPSDPSFFILGDYAQGNFLGPIGSSQVVKAINDDPGSPLLKAPTGWTQVWNDHHGNTTDGAFWSPNAPDGYVALGQVAYYGYDAPPVSNLRCLRRDLVEIARTGNLIWDDKGSHAKLNIELFAIDGVPNGFIGQGNYLPPTFTAYRIRNS